MIGKCANCGKWSLFLSKTALCTNCEKFIIGDLRNRSRIINDSIRIIESSKNFETRLNRCETLARQVTKLLEYQNKGIKLKEIMNFSPSLEEIYTLSQTTRNEILTEKTKSEKLQKICPYCQKQLEKPVKRNRKCPYCGNQIIVRSSKLYTKDEFDELLQSEKEKTTKEIDQNNRGALQQYKASGVVKYVEILCAHDACDNCKKWSNKKIPLDKAIKDNILPIRDCTNKSCRCTYIPVVDFK